MRHCKTAATSRRVYPRARGGAARCSPHRCLGYGLSPRTRGSPMEGCMIRRGGRSIPAHAGEPPSIPATTSSCGVYPRARGGAGPELMPSSVSRGLSPRTRGSPAGSVALTRLLRSIPAHAGEPSEANGHTDHSWVYPRARGGASCAICLSDSKWGTKKDPLTLKRSELQVVHFHWRPRVPHK